MTIPILFAGRRFVSKRRGVRENIDFIKGVVNDRWNPKL